MVKCDILSNNLYESFNNAILVARGMVVLEMLEWIGGYFSQRRVQRREWVCKFTSILLPNSFTKLEEYKKSTMGCVNPILSFMF